MAHSCVAMHIISIHEAAVAMGIVVNNNMCALALTLAHFCVSFVCVADTM